MNTETVEYERMLLWKNVHTTSFAKDSVSDMEFDSACGRNNATNFEVIKRKYKAAGYTMPVICFWNVNSRNDQSPVTKDQNGTILVSGCSPSIFSQVISGTTVTPYDFMLQTLNKERYSSVVG